MSKAQTASDDCRTMIDDCVTREERLSDWQRGFVDSLSRQLDDGKTLTTKQLETLVDVWESVTSTGHMRR